MLALVLMVGIVIDDAIVVLENIFRFVEEKKMRPFDAAREATADIGLAVMATTLSLVVIFVPVSFMSSISGRFLYQFGARSRSGQPVHLVLAHTDGGARMLRSAERGGTGARRARSPRFLRTIERATAPLACDAPVDLASSLTRRRASVPSKGMPGEFVPPTWTREFQVS
jgi:HAE1 family hydrophobic/amphiphilic exporter-1